MALRNTNQKNNTLPDKGRIDPDQREKGGGEPMKGLKIRAGENT